MSTSDDPAAELAAAHEHLQRLEDEPPVDPADVDVVADAYEAVVEVLDRWEERATDWDDFEGYVEFRDDLSETMSEIPEDVPESEAFLEADSHVKTGSPTKSLNEKDFEAARGALAPAREYAEYRDELEAARRRYREAYRAARRRRRDIEERIEELERLQDLGEADLDAPIEDLRDPIERYNDAVTEAFDAFRADAPAREFLAFARTVAADYPLVDVEAPPDRLLQYVRERPAGEHTVPELLEYADYSESKLAHYVDDADRLKRRVATTRTYQEGISAEPLRIGWPPPDAETLRYRIEELLSVVGRFAGEDTTRALRTVRALTRDQAYATIREAAVAAERLSEEERERVDSGAVEAELEAAREEHDRLTDAIESHPAP